MESSLKQVRMVLVAGRNNTYTHIQIHIQIHTRMDTDMYVPDTHPPLPHTYVHTQRDCTVELWSLNSPEWLGKSDMIELRLH